MFYDFMAVYYVNACVGYILSWPVGWLFVPSSLTALWTCSGAKLETQVSFTIKPEDV